MATSLDGSHWGLHDWYPEIEAGIKKALKRKTPWTTGWYSSKKEIASARLEFDGHTITAEVSVSDDFDTPGRGLSATSDLTLEAVRKAIE